VFFLVFLVADTSPDVLLPRSFPFVAEPQAPAFFYTAYL